MGAGLNLGAIVAACRAAIGRDRKGQSKKEVKIRLHTNDDQTGVTSLVGQRDDITIARTRDQGSASFDLDGMVYP
ncbi:MAG: hypothetical protein EAZ61_01335 [Oscillatoriales cyanobacterium]|nr:MAG: hypothetical protein EAZ61_01335 [Oscillatoriales cyanobacterium]